jgi:competence protein ComEC
LAASWGFALSVAATAGILLLAPIAQERIEASPLGERAPPALTLAITITLAAQVATAPVLLAMGAYVGIAAVPANVLAMPLVPLITISGLAAALVGTVPGGQLPAQFLAWVGAWAGEWIARVAGVFADVDFLRIRGSPAAAAAFVIVSATFVIAWRITARPRWQHARLYVVVVGLTAAIAVSLWWLFPPNNRTWPPNGWVLTQCDVGQGDGLVIAPAGAVGAVVVDTGVSARVIDTCLSDLGIDHISALILTHFHADHVSGLAGVVDGRRVDAVFATVFDEPVEQFEGVVYELERRDMQLRRLTAGAEIRIGDGRYRVLWPRRIITTGQLSEGSAANNASVVLDARVHGVRVLLTGDIEPPAQAAILGERGGFDIAKVPHHGSRHQHPRFAAWANAEIALVSVGRANGFGHPAAEALEAWSESGAMVLRTDHSGDIVLVKNDDGTFAVTTRHDMLSTP